MLINNNVKPRIKARSKFGSGDNGLTSTSCCKRNSKYNSIEVDIDEALEDLRLSISEVFSLTDSFLYKFKSLYSYLLKHKSKLPLITSSYTTPNNIINYNVSCELRSLLEWLYENSFSIGAFVYCYKENSIDNKHSFQAEDLQRVESLCLSLRSELGDCKDFLIHKELLFSKLDNVRVNIRKIERLYHGWLQSKSYLESDILIVQISMLNRLSDLLFWLIRKEYKLKKVQESHWHGYMKPIRFS